MFEHNLPVHVFNALTNEKCDASDLVSSLVVPVELEIKGMLCCCSFAFIRVSI